MVRNRRSFLYGDREGNLHSQDKAIGGRVGTAKLDDGQIDLKLDRPVEMGKGNGISPEPLDVTESALRKKRGLNRPNVEALRLQSRCQDLFRYEKSRGCRRPWLSRCDVGMH